MLGNRILLLIYCRVYKYVIFLNMLGKRIILRLKCKSVKKLIDRRSISYIERRIDILSSNLDKEYLRCCRKCEYMYRIRRVIITRKRFPSHSEILYYPEINRLLIFFRFFIAIQHMFSISCIYM